MKNTSSTILSIASIVVAAVALVLVCLNPQPSGKGVEVAQGSEAQSGDIVYVRIDTLIMQYDMYSDLRSSFEAKATSVQDDLNKKGRKLESDIKAFENQYSKGLLTRSAAEQQQNSLQQRQQELQELAQQKQGELMEENNVLMNQVMEAIRSYLESYNETRQFAAILTTSESTNTVIIGDAALDITDEVLEGLNEEYAKNRTK